MATYRTYGGTAADYFASSSGAPIAGATATVWTARTGGTRITDLLTITGAVATTVTSDSTGGFIFQVVDTAVAPVWLEVTSGGKRYAAIPLDLAVKIASLEADIIRSVNGVQADAAGNVVISTGTGTGGSQTVGTTSGTVAAGDDSRIVNALQTSRNLSDLAAPATARTNLGLDPLLSAKAPLANPTFTGTVGGINKTMVGLPNVDNTSDLSKPPSTAVATALGRLVVAQVIHDGSASGPARPTGYFRVDWFSPPGSNHSRPTNMAVNDRWEHDA